ncbi:TonB-dependent receptor [Sphingomonas sp.]|uniref:TonB-dependent receptor n=1 Tax=Sphingomonas sp. TaxID=28214 RepID=UPI002DD644A0|nr:TonB-dependent receptor [Sphingomonas sp.]
MADAARLKSIFAAGAAACALTTAIAAQAQVAPAGTPPAAPSAGHSDDIIVTAQRRSESLQDVPIAVSAFSGDLLQAQKIDTGADLQTGVPNLTFSKGSRGDNITIRGIGNKQFTSSGDTTVGVHFNGAPMTDNRLFEADFFDVERVEVLRGPQGTLYGRNATGGVINLISAKPTGKFEGFLGAELQNYDGRKFRGMLNVPILDDRIALRVAGFSYNRDGFVTNVLNGGKLDSRNIHALRATLQVKPTDTLTAYALFQRFREDDDRIMTGKSACVRDNGPGSVGGVAVTSAVLRGFLSQGCANVRIDPNTTTDVPNFLTTLFGVQGYRAGVTPGDVFAGKQQVAGVDNVESQYDPIYIAQQDHYEAGITWSPVSTIDVNYLTTYTRGYTDIGQDGYLAKPTLTFTPTALVPNGIVNDPQMGPGNSFYYYNELRRTTKQWFHELRFSSAFDGLFNFSLGGNYLHYKLNPDNYIFSHVFTAFANSLNGGNACALGATNCVYIEPNERALTNATGHNYYRSLTPYELKSKAAFGEIYLKFSPAFKVTGGLRYTEDKKRLFSFPVRLGAAGSGYAAGNPPYFDAKFEAVTGRVGFDWQADLGFSNSLIYGFASRGYKGGGINGVVPGVSLTYKPEYVNALEFGMKNTMMGGDLVLNLSAFYYDYRDYQISKYVNRTAITENVDATIKGLEIEAIARPVEGLRLNLTGGLLDTTIKNGTSLDFFDRTQGDASLTLVKNTSASTCVVPTAALGNLIAIIQQNPGAPVMAGVSGNPLALLNACAGTYATSLGITPTQGVDVNLSGKDLPNAPRWTVSFGAQYTVPVSDSWNVTMRGDVYRQGRSYARVFNGPVDYMPGWGNMNLSLRVEKPGDDVAIELFVKNLANNRPVTDYLYNDDSIGLLPRAYVKEPRVISLGVSKKF